MSVNQSVVIRNDNKWKTIMQESLEGAPSKGKLHQSINDGDMDDFRSEF